MKSMNARPANLHPSFQLVTIPAEQEPDVQRQPHNSIDFVLTPQERDQAALASVELERQRRARNVVGG